MDLDARGFLAEAGHTFFQASYLAPIRARVHWCTSAHNSNTIQRRAGDGSNAGGLRDRCYARVHACNRANYGSAQQMAVAFAQSLVNAPSLSSL